MPPHFHQDSGSISTPTWTHTRQRSLGTWVFGGLLFVFILAVFIFAPPTLPEFKHRLLAICAALLAGFFAYFLTGEMGLEIKGLKSGLGEIALRAAGGLALFTLVLLWWSSPLAPVTEQSLSTEELPVISQTLAGSIRDAAGEPLAGVTVSLPEFGLTTTTDDFGRFQFQHVEAARQKTVELMAQAAGYQTREQYATLGNTQLSFTLERKAP